MRRRASPQATAFSIPGLFDLCGTRVDLRPVGFLRGLRSEALQRISMNYIRRIARNKRAGTPSPRQGGEGADRVCINTAIQSHRDTL